MAVLELGHRRNLQLTARTCINLHETENEWRKEQQQEFELRQAQKVQLKVKYMETWYFTSSPPRKGKRMHVE